MRGEVATAAVLVGVKSTACHLRAVDLLDRRLDGRSANHICGATASLRKRECQLRRRRGRVVASDASKGYRLRTRTRRLPLRLGRDALAPASVFAVAPLTSSERPDAFYVLPLMEVLLRVRPRSLKSVKSSLYDVCLLPSSDRRESTRPRDDSGFRGCSDPHISPSCGC